MYKRILVPLDGSKLAEIALSYIRHLAIRLPGVEVVLLHVCNPHEKSLVPMHKAYIEQAADIIRRQPGGVEEVEVMGELVAGSPADEILRYIDKNNINMVIMATHGRSGINLWAMGSVAYKVLRSSRVPVCLVRAGITEEMIVDRSQGDKILVPLDGTKLAESVLPHVEALVKQFGADKMEVVLLRVCESPDISADYPSSMPLSWEEHIAKEKIKCRLVAGVYLAEVGKRLKNAGLKICTEVPTGQPSERIVDYANQDHISLVVMATHGRSGISRWAYGSIAEQVMLKTFTPVVLVGQR